MKAIGVADNRLSRMDHAAFQAMRAIGHGQLVQGVWIYEHPVDFDGLRRFRHNLRYGLGGRRIERSPLPFARHRWVSSPGSQSHLDIAECARPRAELSDWIDERAQLPIDPEWGPGWHLGVLRLMDGSTAISLVGSHCLVDGVGAMVAIFDAVKGGTRDLGYPPMRSRTRLGAVLSDARQTVREMPELARALGAAAKLAVRRRRDVGQSMSLSARHLGEEGNRNVVVPAITIWFDLDDWDARAKSLGGNSYSLLAAFAAKLGERMGRRRADGAVALRIAISDRTLDDTRANAMSFAKVDVDPTGLAADLSGARVTIREALRTLREAPDDMLAILPLIPFVPKRALKRVADMLLDTADFPVSCSNFGDLDPAISRIDGTDAEYVMLRGVDQRVTQRELERAGGQLVLVSGRIGDKISIAVVAYQPGGTNSKPHLRDLASLTLAEFDLTGLMV